MEPKIRFKGFEDAWKNDIIKNISDTFSGGTPSVSNKLYYGGDIPFIRSGEINSIRTELSLTQLGLIESSAKMVRKGTLLYAMYGATSGEVGVSLVDGAINQAILAIIPHNGINTHYLLYLLQKEKSNIVDTYLQGGQGNLSGKIIKDLEIHLPVYSEQLTIASFFQSIDAQITSSKSRLASLKQIKVASLQSMFPQEGETVPKVRFKGFEGEWTNKSFGKLYKRSSIKNDLSFDSSKIISVANMYFNGGENIVDEAYLLTYNVMKLGDIAFEGHSNKSFAHGRFVENCIGDGIVSHIFVVFSPISEKYDIDFWKYYINNESIMGAKLARCTKSSTMMKDLVVNDFLKESILVPSIDEQKAIASFFRSLDRKISLETARLEKLKQIKAACLDKMFV